MAYTIEKQRKLWKPWYWELILSSHGMSWGWAWTRRGAERRILMEQGRWFAGG